MKHLRRSCGNRHWQIVERGRPAATYIDCLKEDMVLKTGEPKTAMTDRGTWRQLVEVTSV